jgi:hypothetical protein
MNRFIYIYIYIPKLIIDKYSVPHSKNCPTLEHTIYSPTFEVGEYIGPQEDRRVFQQAFKDNTSTCGKALLHAQP